MNEPKIDIHNIPQHIAIIMDGNGRWATERGKERSYGQPMGAETGRRSTSDWTRLMKLQHSWGLCLQHLKMRFL